MWWTLGHIWGYLVYMRKDECGELNLNKNLIIDFSIYDPLVKNLPPLKLTLPYLIIETKFLTIWNWKLLKRQLSFTESATINEEQSLHSEFLERERDLNKVLFENS